VKVFLSHGGPSSLNEAAIAAVPIVMLPKGGDQVANTQNAVDLGFGIDASEQTSDGLRVSLIKAMWDTDIAAAAARVAEAMRALQNGPGLTAVAALLRGAA